MEFLSFLLFLSLVSLSPQALAHCPCTSPSPHPKVPILPPVIGKPPITLPPVVLPPVIGKPPITLPPVVLPPVIGKPPITLPPVVLPPVTVPPVITPVLPPVIGKPPKSGCAPPTGATTCPIDTLKLGVCLDVLGAIGVKLGDPAVKCCPLIQGLTSGEAAICLCTTIKLKALGLNIFLPIATELLVTCGKTPPAGYNCA